MATLGKFAPTSPGKSDAQYIDMRAVYLARDDAGMAIRSICMQSMCRIGFEPEFRNKNCTYYAN